MGESQGSRLASFGRSRAGRRELNRHGYPPDKQEKAAQTVLAQAELIAKDWAG